MRKHAEDLSRVISDVFKTYLGSANPKQLENLQRSTAELATVLEGLTQQSSAIVCKRIQEATSSGFDKVLEHFTELETEIKKIVVDAKVFHEVFPKLDKLDDRVTKAFTNVFDRLKTLEMEIPKLREELSAVDDGPDPDGQDGPAAD